MSAQRWQHALQQRRQPLQRAVHPACISGDSVLPLRAQHTCISVLAFLKAMSILTMLGDEKLELKGGEVISTSAAFCTGSSTANSGCSVGADDEEPTARASRALRASALLAAARGSALCPLWAAAAPGGVLELLSVMQSRRQRPQRACARAALLAAAPLCAARSCVIFAAPAPARAALIRLQPSNSLDSLTGVILGRWEYPKTLCMA